MFPSLVGYPEIPSGNEGFGAIRSLMQLPGFGRREVGFSSESNGEGSSLNLYLMVGNDPVNKIDFLGLEEVKIKVKTVIRPPDAQPGTKSFHALQINDFGRVTNEVKFIGVTQLVGFAFDGTGADGTAFTKKVEMEHPKLKVNMTLSTRSKALPVQINYNLSVTIDFCSHTGKLTGSHDGYPSYEVTVSGNEIYDHNQGHLGQLVGSSDARVDVSFSW
jgi:hypothetical protein